jgi:hypothetical protein
LVIEEIKSTIENWKEKKQQKQQTTQSSDVVEEEEQQISSSNNETMNVEQILTDAQMFKRLDLLTQCGEQLHSSVEKLLDNASAHSLDDASFLAKIEEYRRELMALAVQVGVDAAQIAEWIEEEEVRVEERPENKHLCMRAEPLIDELLETELTTTTDLAEVVTESASLSLDLKFSEFLDQTEAVLERTSRFEGRTRLPRLELLVNPFSQ